MERSHYVVSSASLPLWPAPSASRPLNAWVKLPGSKSAAARALILAGLGDGSSQLSGLPQGRDTQLMIAGLQKLGVNVTITADTAQLTPPDVPTASVQIDCGLSGTVMRFLPALAAVFGVDAFFYGDPEAALRPVSPLLDALRGLGAKVSENQLPFHIKGSITGNQVVIDASQSSQFISALLLIAARLPDGLRISHSGDTLPSLPHIEMTVKMLSARGVSITNPELNTWEVTPGIIAATSESIEPDLTNTATFLAAAIAVGGKVSAPWPLDSVQPARQLLEALQAFGAQVSYDPAAQIVSVTASGDIAGVDLDLNQISELTPVAAALAALSSTPSTLRGIAHIRNHETDRIAALATELSTLGSKVIQTDDGLQIIPRKLHAGTFNTYADHRMAHAAALIGLKIPGIQIADIAATTKTIPDFPDRWQQLFMEA